MGRRQIARGERVEGGPYAYIIDAGAQHDPGAAVELLRILRTAGVEELRREHGRGLDTLGARSVRVRREGAGQVVLLGFRPDTCGQSRNVFKLLFNPLYASTVKTGS